MYEDFFEMKKTPFVRSIPVDDLYMDQDTEEIHNRLLYAKMCIRDRSYQCTMTLFAYPPRKKYIPNNKAHSFLRHLHQSLSEA